MVNHCQNNWQYMSTWPCTSRKPETVKEININQKSLKNPPQKKYNCEPANKRREKVQLVLSFLKTKMKRHRVLAGCTVANTLKLGEMWETSCSLVNDGWNLIQDIKWLFFPKRAISTVLLQLMTRGRPIKMYNSWVLTKNLVGKST